jgi:hypothetical protein
MPRSACPSWRWMALSGLGPSARGRLRPAAPDHGRPAVRAYVAHSSVPMGRRSSAVPASDARSAVEHRPADVVPQPLVLEHELANRLRKLVALPPALRSPRAFRLTFRCAGTRGLDRIGRGTELVRGDVRDDCGLAGGVRGMPSGAAQVSGSGLGISGRLARLHHLHFAAHPRASMLDRRTRSWIFGLGGLEQPEDVLRARCRPKSEELVMRIGQRPTATDRHEAGVSDLREDHRRHVYHVIARSLAAVAAWANAGISETRGWRLGLPRTVAQNSAMRQRG